MVAARLPEGLAWELRQIFRPMFRRSRMQVWVIWASTSILLCTCLIHLTTLEELWQPQLLPTKLPSCISSHVTPGLQRDYKNNGYLMVSSNGGLNQMRSGNPGRIIYISNCNGRGCCTDQGVVACYHLHVLKICDMVTIAKHLNVTLVVPELDKTSFWADPRYCNVPAPKRLLPYFCSNLFIDNFSDFGDVFDTTFFIASLKNSVRIIKELPKNISDRIKDGSMTFFSMPPGSWSNELYYVNTILPLIKKHTVVHLNKTDTRLANYLPMELQQMRCHVNFHALRFTPLIEALGRKLVETLRAKGPFLVLHLRYEMDMLAFSGCTNGCTQAEADELTRMRYAYTWWKEKVIVSEEKRREGLCPLTPEETALVLKGLGYDRETQIYIAAGEIFGGEKRMAPLQAAFPHMVRKEMLLTPKELKPLLNRSSQMAALDYFVSLASDVFIPTYYGNMAKVVEGHRRYLGFLKTILLDQRGIVEIIDQYKNGTLDWDNFSSAIRQAHEGRTGTPFKRRVIPGQPKQEDYFYSNPQECLCSSDDLGSPANSRLPS